MAWVRGSDEAVVWIGGRDETVVWITGTDEAVVWVGVPEEDVAWVAWVGGSGKNEGEVCRIAIDPWALPVVTTPLPVWLLPPWCLPPMPLQAPRGPPPPPRSAARPPPSPPVPLTAPPNPMERIPDQWTLRAAWPTTRRASIGPRRSLCPTAGCPSMY